MAGVVPLHAASLHFSREPPFLPRGLSYIEEMSTQCADRLKERTGGVDSGGGSLI
jgi:hypothetical protein